MCVLSAPAARPPAVRFPVVCRGSFEKEETIPPDPRPSGRGWPGNSDGERKSGKQYDCQLFHFSLHFP